MASSSILDHLVDKLSAISSKMMELSFRPDSTTLHLLDHGHSFFHHSYIETDNGFFENNLPSYFDCGESVQTSQVDLSLVKSLGKTYLNPASVSFSPHLFSVVKDSLQYKQKSKILSTPNIADMLFNLAVSNPSPMESSYSGHKSQPMSSKPVPLMKTNDQHTITMSVSVQSANMFDNKPSDCSKSSFPTGMALNVELVNRKNKELQKRSKKRRRRLKKGQNQSSPSSKSSQKCPSQDFEKDSQFIVTVKQQIPSSPTFMSQFLISVAGLSDDDSDWESFGGKNELNNCQDFGFSGLFVANVSPLGADFSPSGAIGVECSFASYTKEELEEMSRLRAALVAVNKNWNEKTKNIAAEPKLATKVSFASEDHLVQVLPVEVFDRKGEWEMYATERIRFRHRINDLEKIISPCLAKKHRSNIYKQYFQDAL